MWVGIRGEGGGGGDVEVLDKFLRDMTRFRSRGPTDSNADRLVIRSVYKVDLSGLPRGSEFTLFSFTLNTLIICDIHFLSIYLKYFDFFY